MVISESDAGGRVRVIVVMTTSSRRLSSSDCGDIRGLILLNARRTSVRAKRVNCRDSNFVLNLRLAGQNELCDHAKNSVIMTTPLAPAAPGKKLNCSPVLASKSCRVR